MFIFEEEGGDYSKFTVVLASKRSRSAFTVEDLERPKIITHTLTKHYKITPFQVVHKIAHLERADREIRPLHANSPTSCQQLPTDLTASRPDSCRLGRQAQASGDKCPVIVNGQTSNCGSQQKIANSVWQTMYSEKQLCPVSSIQCLTRDCGNIFTLLHRKPDKISPREEKKFAIRTFSHIFANLNEGLPLSFVSFSSKQMHENLTSSPDGGIGRRVGLKHQCPKGCAGSTPAPGTF